MLGRIIGVETKFQQFRKTTQVGDIELEFSSNRFVSLFFQERQNRVREYHIDSQQLFKKIKEFVQSLSQVEIIEEKKFLRFELSFLPKDFNSRIQCLQSELKNISIENIYADAKKKLNKTIKIEDIPENYIDAAIKFLQQDELYQLPFRINMTKMILIRQVEDIRKKLASYGAEEICIELQMIEKEKKQNDLVNDIEFWIYLENILKESILYVADDNILENFYKNRIIGALTMTVQYPLFRKKIIEYKEHYLNSMNAALSVKEFLKASEIYEKFWEDLINWFSEKTMNPVKRYRYVISKPALAISLAVIGLTLLWLTKNISSKLYVASLFFIMIFVKFIPAFNPRNLLLPIDARILSFSDEERTALKNMVEQAKTAVLAVIKTEQGSKIIFSNEFIKKTIEKQTNNVSNIDFYALKDLLKVSKIITTKIKKDKEEGEKKDKDNPKLDIIKKMDFRKQSGNRLYFFGGNDDQTKKPFRIINFSRGDIGDLSPIEQEKLKNKLENWEADIVTISGEYSVTHKIRIPGESGRVQLQEIGKNENDEIEYEPRGYHKGGHK